MSTTTLTDAIIEAIGPIEKWSQQCHAASLALVKSRVLEDFRFEHPGRVARGACKGIGSQHSWVVIGEDVYDRTAIIIDVTAWSYGMTEDRVWVGNMIEDGLHTPHGSHPIWSTPLPLPVRSEAHAVLLDTSGLSPVAQETVSMLGLLDARGWAALWSSGGMQGWPAGEVLDAFLEQHPDMRGLVPVDIVGHLTNRNPGGLYLAG